jgi:hypothetical protein
MQLRGTRETGGDAVDIRHAIAKVGVAGSNPVVRSKGIPSLTRQTRQR